MSVRKNPKKVTDNMNHPPQQHLWIELEHLRQTTLCSTDPGPLQKSYTFLLKYDVAGWAPGVALRSFI